jgi:hypothetical protein
MIYRAFIEEDLEVPKHLARSVHELCFSAARGVRILKHVEPVERVHIRV